MKKKNLCNKYTLTVRNKIDTLQEASEASANQTCTNQIKSQMQSALEVISR